MCSCRVVALLRCSLLASSSLLSNADPMRNLLLGFFLVTHLLGRCEPLATATTAAAVAAARFQPRFYEWGPGRIRYTKAGRAGDPPIILVHGFGASYDYYRNQIPKYAAAGYQVFGVDLLGFGGSDKVVRPTYPDLPPGYSSTLWARQVLDFHANVVLPESKGRVKEVVIAGNSMGSRVALEAALLAPDTVKGLLLFNAAAGINNKFTLTDTLTPWFIKAFAVPIFTALDVLLKNPGFATALFERTRKPENVRATLQSVYVNKERCDDELVGSILGAAADARALDVFVEVLTAAPGATPDTFLDRIQCPIQLVWGDRDPFTPLDGPYGQYFQKVAETRTNVGLTVVPGGHCPHDDCPAESDAAALAWLQTLRQQDVASVSAPGPWWQKLGRL